MEKDFRQAFIGLGANLGDREATLRAAIQSLKNHPGISAVETSSLYETEPVGGISQPMFLNLVAGVETTLTPEGLLDATMEIERAFGRIRMLKNGPRTLDLDLLTYEGEIRSTTKLLLPHPRIYERAFVVVPFREVISRPRFATATWSETRSKLASPLPTAGVRLFSNSPA